jgi:hypothetical protein
MGTVADQTLPLWVIITPVVHPSAAKLPRTATEVSFPIPM